MKHFLTISLALLATLTIVSDIDATNYCDKGLCNSGPHIGCENLWSLYSPNCSPGAEILNSQDLKDHIVVRHNTYRNYVASGIWELPTSCRMAVMQWDYELEFLAKLNLLKCRSEHDLCRSTPDYPNAGQNVGHIVANADTVATVATDGIILGWFGEGAKATKESIYRFENIPISNFATMVIDKNNRVGCATAAVPIDDKKMDYLLTCNYAFAPVNHTTIYSSCERAGQKCVTSANQDFPNLCSESEIYEKE